MMKKLFLKTKDSVQEASNANKIVNYHAVDPKDALLHKFWTRQKTNPRKAFYTFFSFLFYAILACILIFGYIGLTFPWQTKFNINLWNYSSPDMNRCEVIKDLQKNYLTKGKHKTEVLTLLGKEDEIIHHKGCIQYNLGRCIPLAWDDYNLRVCFDNNDNVTETAILQY